MGPIGVNSDNSGFSFCCSVFFVDGIGQNSEMRRLPPPPLRAKCRFVLKIPQTIFIHQWHLQNPCVCLLTFVSLGLLTGWIERDKEPESSSWWLRGGCCAWRCVRLRLQLVFVQTTLINVASTTQTAVPMDLARSRFVLPSRDCLFLAVVVVFVAFIPLSFVSE